jgi:hypothetical protein
VLGPAEYVCWSERSGARAIKVRQAKPGSRVTVTVAATFDIEGRQGSRRGVSWTTTMVWTMGTMPDTRNQQRNAWACYSSTEGLTGAKFGMKIWTRIGGSCLCRLQTKTILTLTKENKFCQISMKKNKTSFVMIWLTFAWRLLSVLRSIEWLYVTSPVTIGMIGFNKYLLVIFRQKDWLAPSLEWRFGHTMAIAKPDFSPEIPDFSQNFFWFKV